MNGTRDACVAKDGYRLKHGLGAGRVSFIELLGDLCRP